MSKINPNNIELVRTCDVCPEQYDAYYNDYMVGYLRLRWNYFSVRLTTLENRIDNLLYEANPKGHGCFDDCERSFYLNEAKKAICQYLNENEFIKENHEKRLTPEELETKLDELINKINKK